MNTKVGRKECGRSGVVLLTVLVLLLTACFIVAALTSHSVRSMMLARRGLAREKAFICAESGLGYAIMDIRNKIAAGTNLKELENLYANGGFKPCPHAPGEDTNSPQFRFCPDKNGYPAPRIKVEGNTVKVQCGAYDTESRVCCALEEIVSTVSVSASCDYLALFDGTLKMDPSDGLHVLGKIHCNSDVYVGGETYFWDTITCCGGFYNERPDLGAPWRGWVKGGDAEAVWVRQGTDSDYTGLLKQFTGNGWGQMKQKIRELKGQGFVSTWSEDFNWKTWKTAWGNGKYLQPSYLENCQTGGFIDSNLGPDAWRIEAQAKYKGRIQTGEEVQPVHLDIVPENCPAHTLIERPLLKERIFANDWKNVPLDRTEVSDEFEAAKLANRAALTIYVKKDGSVRVYDAAGRTLGLLFSPATVTGKDSETGAYSIATGNYENPFYPHVYQTDNRFFDQREQRVMAPVDIYLDKLLENVFINNALYNANGSGDQGLIYITRDQPDYVPILSAELEAKPGTKTISGSGSYYVFKDSSGQYVFTDASDTGRASLYESQGLVHAEGDYSYVTYKGNGKVKDSVSYPSGTPLSGNVINSPNGNSAMAGKGRSTYCDYDVTTKTNSVIPLMPCVRIRNASDLSTARGAGLSVASDLPIYVEGNFNSDGGKQPNPKSNGKVDIVDDDDIGISSPNGTRTLNRSAMVAGDALTILSPNWSDAYAAPDYSALSGTRWTEEEWKSILESDNWQTIWRDRMEGVLPESHYGATRKASSAVFNGIVMTGSVAPLGDDGDSSYSEGMQNIFRYMEDWVMEPKSKNKAAVAYCHIFNGSLLCLWQSELAGNSLPDLAGANTSIKNWQKYVFQEPERRWQYARDTPPGLSASSSKIKYGEWKRIQWVWHSDSTGEYVSD